MTRSTRLRTKLVVLCTAVVSLFAIPQSIAAVPPDFDQPRIQTVGDETKSLISVFRQTTPVTIPEDLKKMFPADAKTGKSMFGYNSELARPAYARPGAKLPVVWLIPGADNNVLALTQSRAGSIGGGGGGTVNDPFFKRQGTFSYSPSGRGKNRSVLMTIFVPDSIQGASVIRRSRTGKWIETNYMAYNNVIVVRVKKPIAVRVNGFVTKLNRRA